MELIDLPAFYLIIIHVEGKDTNFERINSLFERNCEVIAISKPIVKLLYSLDNVKDARKYLLLENFIAMCFQEKLLSREK
jgi:hypothetical protein